MINEIKAIINNYLNNAQLCCIVTGTIESGGIRISDHKPLIPMELITGNQKSSLVTGYKVRLLRDHGGKQYYILEVVGE